MLPQIIGRPIVRDAIQNQIGQQNSEDQREQGKLGLWHSWCVLATFLSPVTKYLIRAALKKEGFVWHRIHPGGKIWYPECQVAQHSASAGSIESRAAVPLIFSFIFSVSLQCVSGAAHIPGRSSCSFNPLCKKPQRDAQRFVPYVILNFPKLTVKMNHLVVVNMHMW